MRWKTQGNYLTRNFGRKIPFKRANLVLSAMSRQWLWIHLLWIFFLLWRKKKKKRLCFIKPLTFSPKSCKGEILLWLPSSPVDCNLPHCRSTLWLSERLLHPHAVLWIGSQLSALCAQWCHTVHSWEVVASHILWILYNLPRESLWKHTISL